MAGEVFVIAKLAPKNGAFQGIADANQVLVEASGFSGNLSPADTDLQTALATLDSMSAGGGSLSESFGIRMDGRGSPIRTGSKGFRAIPFACTITGWRVVADQAGDLVVDVRKCSYANYPTTASIAGSEKPALSSQDKNEDVALSTWTTAVDAGDVIEFVVDSASGVTKATVDIQYTRTL